MGLVQEGDTFHTKVMKNIWKSPAAGAAAIILLTVVAYIPAMCGGFIWDDDILVTENRLVKANDGLGLQPSLSIIGR